jgi:hypothetical protein
MVWMKTYQWFHSSLVFAATDALANPIQDFPLSENPRLQEVVIDLHLPLQPDVFTTARAQPQSVD